MPTVIIDDEADISSPSPEAPSVPLDFLTPDEELFLLAARALLIDNLDLVEWVVCFACAWAPDLSDGQRTLITNCMLEAFQVPRARNLYVIGYFQEIDDETGDLVLDGATGAATDNHVPSDGGTGVVVPIRHPTWQQAVRAHAEAIEAGDDAAALAPAAAMANNLLHEMMHLCAESPELSGFPKPGLANDNLMCWAIQNMVGISFIWALAQRYPCLQGLDCLPKAADRFFMTSEPGALIPKGTKNGVIQYHKEQFPWAPVPCW